MAKWDRMVYLQQAMTWCAGERASRSRLAQPVREGMTLLCAGAVQLAAISDACSRQMFHGCPTPSTVADAGPCRQNMQSLIRPDLPSADRSWWAYLRVVASIAAGPSLGGTCSPEVWHTARQWLSLAARALAAIQALVWLHDGVEAGLLHLGVQARLALPALDEPCPDTFAGRLQHRDTSTHAA